MADSLMEKVNYILDESDFNDLPLDERKRIAKYCKEQQILDIVQMLEKDKDMTCLAWRNKQLRWLKDCVDTYYSEYRFPNSIASFAVDGERLEGVKDE